jgi:hypothetical protein
MAEGVKFWLDNKNVAGNRVANLGDQVLVEYRSRLYVVANGAAVMKGGKALRYAPTTLPADWRKILKEAAATAVTPDSETAGPAKRPTTRKARVDKGSEETPMSEPTPAAPLSVAPEKAQKAARKAAKTADKAAAAPAVTPPAQTAVPVECPYCQQKQEIPVEKGRSGKPFFQNCVKCQADFAIRFVAVTRYQAQVAGFQDNTAR